MTTFSIVGINTGYFRAIVQGESLDHAREICLEKGLDMYDVFTLVPYYETITPETTHISEII